MLAYCSLSDHVVESFLLVILNVSLYVNLLSHLLRHHLSLLVLPHSFIQLIFSVLLYRGKIAKLMLNFQSNFAHRSLLFELEFDLIFDLDKAFELSLELKVLLRENIFNLSKISHF